MLRSLNSGVSGLKGFQTKLDVIGNNIANVNTSGFKKSNVVFEEVVSQTIKDATAPSGSMGGINPLQVGLGSKVATIQNVFTPGSPTTTNRTNDLYIDGNAFFVVVDDNGNSFLTRSGNFTMDGAGYMVNPDGMRVLGADDNPIDLSAYSSFTVGVNGEIIGISSDGSVESINKDIKLVDVTNAAGLKKEGGSLYSLTDNTTSSLSTTSKIVAGQLEMSNVDLTEEMTEMIIAQRGLQANSKIITVSDQILEEIINLKR